MVEMAKNGQNCQKWSKWSKETSLFIQFIGKKIGTDGDRDKVTRKQLFFTDS